jgi:bacillithiol system protein YtxJ
MTGRSAAGMAGIETIEKIETWETEWTAQAAPEAGRLLILKKSPICPVSLAAEREFVHFVSELPEDPSLRFASVNVIGQRPVSRRIAEDTEVRHESPQVLLIGAGQKVLWHASHRGVNGAALARALG